MQIRGGVDIWLALFSVVTNKWTKRLQFQLLCEIMNSIW